MDSSMRMDELGAGSDGSMSSSTPTAVGGGESPAYPPLSEVSSLRNEYSEESAPVLVAGVQGCPYNALKSRVCGGKLDIVVACMEMIKGPEVDKPGESKKKSQAGKYRMYAERYTSRSCDGHAMEIVVMSC